MSDSNEKYQARAEILKAMAHPSRLRMLDALQGGELCVGELQELVRSDLSTVSRHLSVMRTAGLLSSRREANQIFYALRVPCVLKTFECIEAVLREDARSARKLAARVS
ncbi:MAG TPA: metalloregulator ArsR/SmtB family transcription factor [Anaeromyxobacteraceae bacterium]